MKANFKIFFNSRILPIVGLGIQRIPRAKMWANAGFNRFIIKIKANLILHSRLLAHLWWATLKELLKYLVILFIVSKIISILFSILDYNIFQLLPSEPQGGNSNIPSDQPSDSNWLDNIGPTLVGLSVYRLLKSWGGIGKTGRNIASVGAAGIYATLVLTDKAIENSVGFNRFAVLLKEVLFNVLEEISKVPSSDSSDLNNTDSSSLNSSENLSITESTELDKFLPDSSTDLMMSLFEKLYFSIISFLKPVHVQGYFDDLIGQRLFLEFLLLILSICMFILFVVFIFNLIIYLNKDKIITLFPKNKLFIFILSIETILIKWTLILIPLFIFMGFFTLIKTHIWLITHPIPYDSLGIDLHQFISKKN